jgi:cytochrome c nitrite reductase small subunit
MSSKWPLVIGIVVFLSALGVFAWAADAPAYLGHAPATCNNCHVMDAQYENWFHAPHAAWADCSDCHLPHETLLDYYLYKGKSGIRDVFSFVTRSYPDPAAIRANDETRAILQANCIRCHKDAVEAILAGPQPFERACWECHRSVAHGERGLTLSPYQDSEVYRK